MSAIPEPNRRETTPDTSPALSKNDADVLSMLPDILRGAAYISSGGRVYRLFTESDEAAVNRSSLGEPLRFDPLRITGETVETLTWSESRSVSTTDISIRESSEAEPDADGTVSEAEASLASALETMDAELEFCAEQTVAVPCREETNEDRTTTVTETVRKRRRTTEVREESRVESPSVEDFFATNFVIRKRPVETPSPTQPGKTVSPLRSASRERPSLELGGLRLDIVELEPGSAPEKTGTRQEVGHTLKIFEESAKTVSMPRQDVSLPIETVAIRNDIAIEPEPAAERNLAVLQMTETATLTRIRRQEVHQEIHQEIHEGTFTTETTVVEEVETVVPEMTTETETVETIEAMETVETEKPVSINVIRLHLPPALKRIGPFTPRKFVVEVRMKPEPPMEATPPEPVIVEPEPQPEPAVVTVVEETVVETVIETVLKRETTVEERETISVSVAEEVAETVVEEDPIPFPLQKTTVVEVAGQPAEAGQADSPVWRLHWEPVWPGYLASLEYRASSQIRHLADHLEVQLANGRKVVNFHGFRHGDGSTTLSLCAARELAERGYRLLLADAHPQHPELAMLLDLDVHPHLYEIMTLIPDRLELLPWSESFIETVSRDRIQTTSFADIVASLRNEYDAILLDSGSLTGNPLKKHVGQWRQMRSDGVLLVVNTKNPEPVNVQAVAHRLHQFDVDLLGIAENYV